MMSILFIWHSPLTMMSHLNVHEIRDLGNVNVLIVVKSVTVRVCLVEI